MSDNKLEQKQVMQLIGEWGYTLEQFESYIKENEQRARRVADAVGATAYNSLAALCRYAQCGDFKVAIDEDVTQKIAANYVLNRIQSDNIEDMKINEIFKLARSSNFAEEVITQIYKTCSTESKLPDAEIALRRSVFLTVAPLIVPHINKEGTEITETIIELLVAADNSMLIDGDDAQTREALKMPSKTLLDFIDNVSNYSAEFHRCQSSGLDQFDELINALLGDVDANIKEIKQDILSIIDSSPSVWTQYSIAFGRVMTALSVALSFGYIKYDDYERMLGDFHKGSDALKLPKVDVDKNEHITFGRN